MATLTINTTQAEDARILRAFGRHLGMKQDATAQDVKRAIVDYIKGVVQTQEYQASVEAVQRPAPISPS